MYLTQIWHAFLNISWKNTWSNSSESTWWIPWKSSQPTLILGENPEILNPGISERSPGKNSWMKLLEYFLKEADFRSTSKFLIKIMEQFSSVYKKDFLWILQQIYWGISTRISESILLQLLKFWKAFWSNSALLIFWSNR